MPLYICLLINPVLTQFKRHDPCPKLTELFISAWCCVRIYNGFAQSVRAVCRTPKSSSSRLLGLLPYEVKPAIALTLLELENSAGTIDEFFNSYLACFSVLG